MLARWKFVFEFIKNRWCLATVWLKNPKNEGATSQKMVFVLFLLKPSVESVYIYLPFSFWELTYFS